MRIEIVTAFPEIYDSVFSQSIIKIAISKGLLEIGIHNLRNYADDKRGTVDDRPFGGGPGMVLMVKPIYRAVQAIKKRFPREVFDVYLLTPQGALFNQKMAVEMVSKNLILICGHYEGVDERVTKLTKAKEISIGDYILSGGEIASMAVVDAVARLVPGVIGDKSSLESESFSQKLGGLLDHPSYTRPRKFLGLPVPEVLLGGNHQDVARWRDHEALKKTKKNRPDLLKQ